MVMIRDNKDFVVIRLNWVFFTAMISVLSTVFDT